MLSITEAYGVNPHPTGCFPEGANIEAFRRLISVLKRVEPEHFDLRMWLYMPGVHDDMKALKEGAIPCGTTACAIGHAAMDPWFIEQGFSLEGSVSVCPAYDACDGWDAICLFFQVDASTAFHLFHSESYKDKKDTEPAQVVHRIRSLMHN